MAFMPATRDRKAGCYTQLHATQRTSGLRCMPVISHVRIARRRRSW